MTAVELNTKKIKSHYFNRKSNKINVAVLKFVIYELIFKEQWKPSMLR